LKALIGEHHKEQWLFIPTLAFTAVGDRRRRRRRTLDPRVQLSCRP